VTLALIVRWSELVLEVDGVSHSWTQVVEHNQNCGTWVSVACQAYAHAESPFNTFLPMRYPAHWRTKGALTCITCLALFNP